MASANVKENNDNQQMAALLEKSGMVVTASMRELYIKLLCEFDPDKVYMYIYIYK